jgi:hypothetical protein
MRWFKNLLFRICAVARSRQIEMDLADELKFHLEAEIEKNVAAGMNPEEARYAAARSFGDMEQVKEECRDLIGVRFIAEAWQDVRYGLRMLAKSPGFSAVAVLCLALGIGANTAIFSLIDVALLRPLPIDQPDQLVLVDVAGSQGTGEAFSYPTYQMLRDHNEVFSGMLAFDVVLGPLTAHVNGPAELADGQLVSGNYFSVLVALVLGRAFSPQDNEGSPKAAVINETMARFYFQDENPVGRIFTREAEGSSQQTEIVGVVRDSKFLSPREQVSRAVYVPFLQAGDSPWGMTFCLRTVAHPVGLVSKVRREIEAVNPNLPFFDVRMLDQQVDYSLLRERLIATLATLFGLLAVFLGCIGLYGVMSYAVARRTNEIGIRLALGATTQNILWLVMREAMLLVLIGLAIGLPATLATTRLISSELFGLTNTDSLTISLATLLLVTVAFVAAYLPTRRAARVDPMVTLRTG